MKKWILSLVAVVAVSALIYQVPQTTDQTILADERPVYFGGPGPAGIQMADRATYLGGPGPAGVIAGDFTYEG